MHVPYQAFPKSDHLEKRPCIASVSRPIRGSQTSTRRNQRPAVSLSRTSPAQWLFRAHPAKAECPFSLWHLCGQRKPAFPETFRSEGYICPEIHSATLCSLTFPKGFAVPLVALHGTRPPSIHFRFASDSFCTSRSPSDGSFLCVPCNNPESNPSGIARRFGQALLAPFACIASPRRRTASASQVHIEPACD